MHFLRSFLVAAVAPLLVIAQSSSANPFTLTSTFRATAGQSSTLTWTPTTGGTVTLKLRSGNSADLDTVSTIASGIPNDGSYTWSVPSSAIRGTSYTIEIISDSNPDETNYSAPFSLDSNNVYTATNTGSSSSASSTSMSASSTSGSTMMTSTTGSSTASSTSNASSSSSSSSSATNSASSSSASSASQTSNAAGIQTTSSTGAAPRATAMVGLLGAVALGAFAL